MDLLISRQKGGQQRLVEGAVGVRHKGPGHAVNARQAHQRLIAQHGQIQKEATRQAVVYFLDLRFNQMKVVKQPFRRRADVVTRGGLAADVAVRLAQRHHVVVQLRKKHHRLRAADGRVVRLRQAAAVLCKALRAKYLRPNRRRGRALGAVQQIAQSCGCVGQQTPKRLRGSRSFLGRPQP